MLGLVRALGSLEKHRPFTFVAADTDKTSEQRAKSSRVIPQDTPILTIPRSREVGQSYLIAVWMTLKALLACLSIVLKVRPTQLIVNGPGTCLPMCLAAALLRLLCIHRCTIVFVESVCRVKSLSLTGKILYHLHIADQVQVQWPELLQAYPRARYVGMLM